MMNDSAGTISMSKSFFWPMFKRAWDKAFTKDNIQLAFCKAGIWPTNGIHIIKAIACPVIISLEKPAGILKAPWLAKSIRRFKAIYKKALLDDIVKTLFTITIQLATQVSVLQNQNKGLLKSIDIQKKKNKKGV